MLYTGSIMDIKSHTRYYIVLIPIHNIRVFSILEFRLSGYLVFIITIIKWVYNTHVLYSLLSYTYYVCIFKYLSI